MLLSMVVTVASLVSMVAGTPTPTYLKQTNRKEIIERMSNTHRKRDAPSGTPPPATAGNYNYVGSKAQYAYPNSGAGYIKETSYNGAPGAYALGSATIACSNDAAANSATYFTVIYNPGTQYYYCQLLKGGPYTTADLTNGPQSAWTYTALYGP